MVKSLQILPNNIKSNSASEKVLTDFQVYWCFSYQHEGFNLLSKQLDEWIYFWNIFRPLRSLQCGGKYILFEAKLKAGNPKESTPLNNMQEDTIN